MRNNVGLVSIACLTVCAFALAMTPALTEDTTPPANRPVAIVTPATTTPAKSEGTSVRGLLCEGRTEPEGIDIAQPQFSWRIDSMARAVSQSAYQILVASSKSLLDADKGDVWDSGRVTSERSLHIDFGAGAAFRSSTRYYWKVKIWDDKGVATPWSPTATFLTGKMNQSDWGGAWIGSSLTDQQTLYFRKEFTLDKPLAQAVLNICYFGFGELSCNGRRVTGETMDRFGTVNNATDVGGRNLYNTVDITSRLRNGPNTLGVILATGYANAGTTSGEAETNLRFPPKFILDLDLTYADGTRMTVTSDASWRWSTGEIGPTVPSRHETIDKTKSTPGWDTPGFDDKAWHAAVDKGRTRVAGPMTARTVRPIVARPIAGTDDDNYRTSGWPIITVSGGAAGQTITCLVKLGDYSLNKNRTYTLVCSGKPVEVFEPRFCWGGTDSDRFVWGPLGAATVNVQRASVCSDLIPAGSFSCSDPDLNYLHDVSRRTQANYVVDLPMDTTEEYRFWQEDQQNMQETSSYLFQSMALYRETLEAVMRNNTCCLGNMLGSRAGRSIGVVAGCTLWWNNITWMPFMLHQYYADQRSVASSYPVVKANVDAMIRIEDANHVQICKEGWGDHLSPDHCSKSYIGAMGYYEYIRQAGALASVLGKTEDAIQYATKAAQVRDAINRRYFDPATGIYDGTLRQSAQALALGMDLVPADKKQLAYDRLIEAIRAKKYHPTTGFVSNGYLLKVLMDQGAEDVLYTMAKRKSGLSWFRCAGSLHRLTGMYGEGWNSAGAKFMPSLGGSIALFFYRGLAGIRSDFSTPGFKKFEIRPLVNVPLTQVRCSYDSPYGLIRSDWSRPAVDSTDLTMDVVIPANASAIVSVPTTNPDSVQESGKPAKGATGVTFLGHENGRARFEVRSGTYRFQTASCPKPPPSEVAITPGDATLRTTCDNAHEVYFNGVKVGASQSWNSALQSKVTFKEGKNVIAIKGIDGGGVGAVLAECEARGDFIVSDETWKVSNTLTDHWMTIDFNDSQWQAASVYAYRGEGPWGDRVSGFTGNHPSAWIWTKQFETDDMVYLRKTIICKRSDAATKETGDDGQK